MEEDQGSDNAQEPHAEESDAEESDAGKSHEIFVGFGKDKGCKGRLICCATKAQYSHSWIEYPSNVWGGRWIAHATSRGVIKEFHKHVYDRYPKRVRYRCKIDLDKGIEAVRGRVGRSDYDFGGIVNLLILVLHRATKWKLWHAFVCRNDEKVTCSEFVAIILDEAGVKPTEKLDTEITTTGDLVKLVKNSEHFELVEEQPRSW